MLTRSSNEFNQNNRIIIFDIETCGFNPFEHDIIEISAIDQDGNVFDTLIKPRKNIPKKITEITNITNDMVKDKKDNKSVLLDFNNFINGDGSNRKIYMIGHNSINFDWPFLKAKYNEFNIKYPKITLLDTMRMAQYVLRNEWSHSLKHLCNQFSIKNDNAHRALSDVYATYTLYKNILIIMKSRIENCNLKKIEQLTSI